MRIIQITDLHVGHQGEETNGVDVRQNFLDILKAVQDARPDHLVLSGDLCYRNGEQKIYEWLKEGLDQLQLSYDIISGNHDDPALMASVFGKQKELKEGELYFRKQLSGYTFLFLDTTTGIISDLQLAWLKDQLGGLSRECVIFMHHPPLTAGVPFMDTHHALQNREAVQAILFTHPFNITVFSGHYHVDRTVRKKNVVVHITPSCFFQIDQHSLPFKVDHYRIGYREITLDDGILMNTVQYL